MSTAFTEEIGQVIREAKLLARRYKALTGRPLGITGEVAEYEAARLLGLDLSPARQAGYDATYMVGAELRRVQIKGRCIFERGHKGRLGRIKLDHPWDTVMLVLLDQDLEATAIYEAKRPAIEMALLAPGSRSRNDKGALGISAFKAIAQLIWPVQP
jgi:hypothetical protein